MKKKLTALSVIIVLIIGILSTTTRITPTSASPNVWHIYPGGSIQMAINTASPGDTIIVHPGTYREAILINKPLNITGYGADTTFINGSGVALSAAGLVRITAASGNVIFSGFTVSNAGVVGTTRIGILTKSSVAGPTYTISYNKIYGSNDINEWDDYGFYASGGKEAVVFTHNLITQTGANNIVLELHTGSTEISYDTLDAGVWGTDSIFFMTYNGIDVTTLQNVSCNTFDMGTGGPFDYDHHCTGVSFCSPGGALWPPWDTLTSAKFTNMLISANTFNNLKSYRRAIGTWNANDTRDNLPSPVITGNIVNGVPGSNASFGIDFYGLTTNAVITGNTIEGTEKAIVLREGDAPGTTIRYNNFKNNKVSVDWTLGSSPVDATLNYWGDPTGPYPSGKGDNVSGNVDFEPWLIKPYPPATPVEALLYVNPITVERWTPSFGKTFTVEVKVDNITNFYGYEFKLYWDTTLLDLSKIKITPPWDTFFIAKNETAENLGRYWVSVVPYAVPPFNGSASLVTLTFKVMYDSIYPENKSCALDLADTKLAAPFGVPIYHMVHDGEYLLYSTKPKIAVQPSPCILHALNKIFTVNITVLDVVNLYEFNFTLSYDTTLMDAIDVHVGSFLQTPQYVNKRIIDDAHGFVWVWVWSLDPARPVNGSGIIATITFKTTKANIWPDPQLNCNFALSHTLLKTKMGYEIPHDALNGIYIYDPKPGDVDMDGRVGLTDLRIVAYYYEPNYNRIADLNRDGIVDVYDLSIVASYYGEDC